MRLPFLFMLIAVLSACSEAFVMPVGLALDRGSRRSEDTTVTSGNSPPRLGSHELVTLMRATSDIASSEDKEHDAAMEKATKAMTAFANKYLENTNTKLCSDKSVAAVVIKGLAEHKVNLGAPLCPCRFYDDKPAEAKDGYWNCPCVPMRERHECHCMLFLTEDNPFAGQENKISLDEVVKGTEGVDM